MPWGEKNLAADIESRTLFSGEGFDAEASAGPRSPLLS